MKRHIRKLAGAIVAAVAAALFVGGGRRADGAQREMPVRPRLGVQIERVGRPLIGNALLWPLAPDSVNNARKEAYNRAAPADWSRFTADIARSLALYDAFDRARGNQWLADRDARGAGRYLVLARLLADDRLWIDGDATTCTRFLAVETAALARPAARSGDCGGRTPNHDAVDVLRSLWMNGTITGLEDGVARDEHVHSTTEFPFLAAP